MFFFLFGILFLCCHQAGLGLDITSSKKPSWNSQSWLDPSMFPSPLCKDQSLGFFSLSVGYELSSGRDCLTHSVHRTWHKSGTQCELTKCLLYCQSEGKNGTTGLSSLDPIMWFWICVSQGLLPGHLVIAKIGVMYIWTAKRVFKITTLECLYDKESREVSYSKRCLITLTS